MLQVTITLKVSKPSNANYYRLFTSKIDIFV